MRHGAAPLALVLSLSSIACIAQAPPKAAAADSYAGEAVVIERMETTYRMNDDGTERDIHVIVRVESRQSGKADRNSRAAL